MSDSVQTKQISEDNSRNPWFSQTKTRLRAFVAGDFVGKALSTFATRIVLIGIGLVTTVVVTRILGPEGRGIYAVATALGALGLQFGVLGLQVSNTYFVAKDRSLLPALLGNTLVVSCVIGAVAIAGSYLALSLWPRLALLHGALLLLALLWIPIGMAYLLLQNLLLGVSAIKTFNRTELITRGGTLVIIGCLVKAHLASVTTVFAAGLVALAVMFVVILKCLIKMAGRWPQPSIALFKSNLSYGMRAYLISFFSFLIIRSDLLMLKYLRGPESAGYYSVAVTMSDYVVLLPTVVSSLLLPKLSATHDILQKYRLMKKVVLGVLLIESPLLILSAMLAPMAVRLLFGKAFAPAAPAYLWLVPGMLFLTVHVLSVQFLNSIGCPMSVVWIWLGCAVFKLAMNVWAIPIYGSSGAATVSSMCYLIASVLVWAVITRELHRNSTNTLEMQPEEAVWVADPGA